MEDRVRSKKRLALKRKEESHDSDSDVTVPSRAEGMGWRVCHNGVYEFTFFYVK